MSRFIGEALDDRLLRLLSIDSAHARAEAALVIATVDEHGWAHPAMLSSLEVVARDARNVRLVLHGGSRSARNLQQNGRLTLIVIDPAGVFYVKGDVLLLAASLAAAPELSKFNCRVDSVLEDDPAAYEEARLASGIRIARGRLDAARTTAILRELVD